MRRNGLRAGVFLDRDGTIIEDRGDLHSPSQVVFYAETFEALRRLVPHYALFIVTNQSGVAKGSLTRDDVDRVNAHVVSVLREESVPVEAVYVCPHGREEHCACIKPHPHFLFRAAEEHGIDLSRSYSVGDHPHDADFAGNADGRGIFVLTGHGAKHRDELAPGTWVAEGIAGAVDRILDARESL